MQSIDQEMDLILDALRAAGKQGLSVSELEEALPFSLHRHTLRHRLGALEERGLISKEGRTRSLRYMAINTSAAPLSTRTEAQEATLQHSDEAAQLLAQVRRPMSARPPASYQRQWLERYDPKRTKLWTPAQRAELESLGQTYMSAAPAGTYARQLHERLLIDLSWASSYLEGNTYSLLETKRLIEHGVAAEGKDAIETQMLLNHKRAIEFLIEDGTQWGMRRTVIQNLHAILSENLLNEPEAEGRLRARPVAIGGSTYQPPVLPQLIEEHLELLLALVREQEDPFEQSALILLSLPYLQPFIDVNKRTARLAANLPLFEHNLVPLSFIDVPAQAYIEATLVFYELQRPEPMLELYLFAYARSSHQYRAVVQQLAEPDPFRLKHRELIYQGVQEIVNAMLNAQPQQLAMLEPKAEDYARAKLEEPVERARLTALILTDLNQLHEGNFARYRITPAQLEAWLALKNGAAPNP